jgi:hypothetical protein
MTRHAVAAILAETAGHNETTNQPSHVRTLREFTTTSAGSANLRFAANSVHRIGAQLLDRLLGFEGDECE